MVRKKCWGIVLAMLLAGHLHKVHAANSALEEYRALFPDRDEESDAPPKRTPRKRRPPPSRRSKTTAPPQFSGSFREEFAYRLSSPQQLTKFRSVLQLALTGTYRQELSYKLSTRLRHDAVYDITHNYPKSVGDDQKLEGELRDTYVDWSKESWDLRLGKQQIVWGEALDLFFADVVNAKDFREFVLPDFETIRIPEWAANAEYTHEAFHAEAIWLPWPEMNRIARPGAEWAPHFPVPAGIPYSFAREEKPDDSLENGQVGARLSYQLAGWDASLFHLRTWDKTPVYESVLTPSGLVLTPTHPRLSIEGLSIAKDLDGTVFRGEAVYYVQKYFETTNPLATRGILPKDYIDYFASVDREFSNRIHGAFQISQRLIRDFEDTLIGQKALRTYVSVWVRRPFWNDKLEPAVSLLKEINGTNLMFRPRVSYKFAGRWRVSTGVDVLDGPVDGIFGQYSQRNRVWSEVRVDF